MNGNLLLLTLLWFDTEYPPLAHLQRFPDAECTRYNLQIVQDYEARCGRLSEDNRNVQLAFLWPVKKAWEDLSIARDETQPMLERRRAIHWLRLHLGDYDFAQGHMPDPLPRHYFTEVP